MPLNSSGTYVPLTAAERQEIGMRAGQILRDTPGLSPLDVGIRVARSVHIDNSDSLVVYGIIRNERAANALGSELTGHPGERPSPIGLPTTPVPPEQRGEVVTDYVVTFTDPLTGDKWTSRERVTSPDPMSADDIRNAVENDTIQYHARNTVPGASGADHGGLNISIIVLQVSRGR